MQKTLFYFSILLFLLFIISCDRNEMIDPVSLDGKENETLILSDDMKSVSSIVPEFKNKWTGIFTSWF